MARQIYVNLPVGDLPRSKAFFQSLGFAIEPKLSNDVAACVVLSEGSVYAMLLTHPVFQGFAPAPIADATRATGVINCLSCASRQEVDDLTAKAVAAGGKTHKPPVDHGFMYGHGFHRPRRPCVGADVDGRERADVRRRVDPVVEVGAA